MTMVASKGECGCRPLLRPLSLILKILVSAAALIWLFSVIRWDILTHRLREVNWALAVLSFAVGSLWIVPCASRWRLIACRCGYPLTFKESIRGYLLGAFFNSFLPTDKGGDVVRGILTARRNGFPVSGLLGTILIERLNGLKVILAWVFCVSLIFVQPGVQRKNICVSAAAAYGLLMVLSRLLSWPGCWKQIQRLPFPNLRAAADNVLKVWLRCMQSTQTMLLVTAYSLLNLLLVVFSAWIQGQAISGFNAPGFSYVLVVPLTFIAGLLPSIGGYGVKEVGLVIGFGWFGVSPESAAVFGILLIVGRWITAAAGAALFAGSTNHPS